MSGNCGCNWDPANKFTGGQRLLRAGDYQAAIQEFSAAITLDPDHSIAYFRRAEAYRNVGMVEHARADIARWKFLMRLVRQEAAEKDHGSNKRSRRGDGGRAGCKCGAIVGAIVGGSIGVYPAYFCYWLFFIAASSAALSAESSAQPPVEPFMDYYSAEAWTPAARTTQIRAPVADA